ncbi:MAG: ATP-binding protein [Proteobacteria bacterium]|nr:ATP-binding protein [Pseudomonadota bacterium]
MPRCRTALVSGPAQVGKTTACKALSPRYLDWDDPAGRLILMRGAEAVARHLDLERAREREVTVVFDNLQGHPNWRGFLRKFTARCGARVRVVATFRSPGRKKSLPASTIRVRINPWSVAECVRTLPTDSPTKAPANISEEDWFALQEHGGFPEPFHKRDPKFTERWHARQQSELIEHDLPRLAAVRNPSVLQMLALLLAERSATPLVYSALSRQLGVSVDTVTRWIELLVDLSQGFCVRPWFAGVPKALRKEPRWFLRDWSAVMDASARARTLIACHLLKAVEGWSDLGFGQFELRYVRDKRQREVDFLVLRDRRPWFLVAVGDTVPRGGEAPPVLRYFQRITRARHAFHLVMNGSFTATDCFAQSEPLVVSARTLLSQLL